VQRHYSIREFTVKQLLEYHDENRLRMDTAYQRGRVWKDREKHYLIDSLARGLPVGMITLFSALDEEGVEFFEVIDGKQRLTTIFEFLNDGFELPVDLEKDIPTSAFRRDETANASPDVMASDEDDVMHIEVGQQQRELLQGKKFRTLPLSSQRRFKDVVLPGFVVRADKRHLAVDIFVRMNKNVKGLVPQEIRNAVYHKSTLLKAAAEISHSMNRKSKKELDSKSRWFCQSGFMNVDRFDRQADVQFVLELLVLALHGPTHRRDELDVTCDRYIKPSTMDTKLLEKKSEEVKDGLNKVAAICEKGFRHYSFPKNLRIENDVYALVGALLKYGKSLQYIKDNKLAYGEVVTKFLDIATILNQAAKGGKGAKAKTGDLVEGEFEELAFRYSQTYLGGQTNSAQRRTDRIEIWRDVLELVAPSNDTKRMFSPVQKSLLWALAKEKKCAKCGVALEANAWDAGHIEAWKDSGRTTIENGQLECASCNRGNR